MRQQIELTVQQKKIYDALAEMRSQENQLSTQLNRVQLAQDSAERYRDLVTRGFVSQEQLRVKEGDLLDQKDRKETIHRQIQSLQNQANVAQLELDAMSFRHKGEMEELNRSISTAMQQLAENESKHGNIISAPVAGTISAMSIKEGQTIDTSEPLLSIIPNNALLEAHLYAPSRSIGFIKVGDVIKLRYQAFPSQKYGLAMAVIKTIASSALTGGELNEYAKSGLPTSSEPIYQIVAQLKSQTISINGDLHNLKAGMQFDAEILLEKKPILDWMLNPLRALSSDP